MSKLIEEFVKDSYAMPDIDWFIDRWIPKLIEMERRLAESASREQSLMLQLGEVDSRITDAMKILNQPPHFVADDANLREAALIQKYLDLIKVALTQ